MILRTFSATLLLCILLPTCAQARTKTHLCRIDNLYVMFEYDYKKSLERVIKAQDFRILSVLNGTYVVELDLAASQLFLVEEEVDGKPMLAVSGRFVDLHSEEVINFDASKGRIFYREPHGQTNHYVSREGVCHIPIRVRETLDD